MNTKDEVIAWLRDAYAMERGMEVTLRKMADSDSHTPECREAAAQHLEETRQHAQTVEALLHSLGSDTSSVKTGLGIMTETVKGFGTSLAHDETVKDLLASYAMEHFEIACYRALIAAAEALDLTEVADACEDIIADEEQMGETILGALPDVVENHLAADAAI